MWAIVLVAGKGTRLLPLTEELPKSMLFLDDKPILHYILNSLYKEGVTHVVLAEKYKPQTIQSYFSQKDIIPKGMQLIPQEIQGEGKSAQAIYQTLELINNHPDKKKEIIIMHGDIYAPKFPFRQLLKTHEKHTLPITLTGMKISKENPLEISVKLGDEGSISEIHLPTQRRNVFRNAAIFVVDNTPEVRKSLQSMQDFFSSELSQHFPQMGLYYYEGTRINVNTLENLSEAQAFALHREIDERRRIRQERK